MRVHAVRCLRRSCTCDRTGREQKTENFQRTRITRRYPHSPAPTVHIRMQNRLRSIVHNVPTCPHGSVMEIQFIKVTVFQVQNGEILTFRILTHEVVAGQDCFIHRWSTHTTTLMMVGSIGLTWVAHEAGERSKFESQSRISIISAISCNSLIGSALHAPCHILPAHIIASP
jgi:hypothetical protein